jgi:hypothetical protein
MRRLLPIGLFVVTAALSACGGRVAASDVGNAAPRARLSAPLDAPATTPVVLDASASYDPDGIVSEYTFSFGDGSGQVTQTMPEVSHAFAEPGAYQVTVVVRDNGGQLARASQLVVVRADATVCATASDCSSGTECRDSLCYTSEAQAGAGAADCNADTDCGHGLSCLAGFCLSAQGSR